MPFDPFSTIWRMYSIAYLTLSQKALVFTCLQHRFSENTVGKGEIARNEQFLLFSTVFSICLETSVSFSTNLKLPSANSLSLEESKI